MTPANPPRTWERVPVIPCRLPRCPYCNGTQHKGNGTPKSEPGVIRRYFVCKTIQADGKPCGKKFLVVYD